MKWSNAIYEIIKWKKYMIIMYFIIMRLIIN